MNNTATATDKATTERRNKTTAAFIEKMHRVWHQVRKIEVCDTLTCEHPWYPR